VANLRNTVASRHLQQSTTNHTKDENNCAKLQLSTQNKALKADLVILWYVVKWFWNS